MSEAPVTFVSPHTGWPLMIGSEGGGRGRTPRSGTTTRTGPGGSSPITSRRSSCSWLRTGVVTSSAWMIHRTGGGAYGMVIPLVLAQNRCRRRHILGSHSYDDEIVSWLHHNLCGEEMDTSGREGSMFKGFCFSFYSFDCSHHQVLIFMPLHTSHHGFAAIICVCS